MNDQKAAIAVALDLPTFQEIERTASAVSPFVRILKIGLQTYYRDGQRAIDLVRELQCELFLDLKLHDIPNTVRGACQSLAHIEPDYLTVHASGGVEMMKSAVAELPSTKITAVTALTSLSESDIRHWGEISIDSFTKALTQSSVDAGARAIVCSGHEVKKIRSIVGTEMHIVVPGIRQMGDANDDQQRTMTLTNAMQSGADVLVIGRPITHATSPKASAEAFADEYWAYCAK